MTRETLLLALLALPLMAAIPTQKADETLEVPFYAEELIASDVSGTGTCNDPAKVVLNSGPESYAMTCTDAATSVFEGAMRAPYGWNGQPLEFDLSVTQTADLQQTFTVNVAAQCCEARGGEIAGSFGTSVKMRLGATTGNGYIDTVTSAAVTPSGTCSGGDWVFWQMTVDATETVATMASLYILGVVAKYEWTPGTVETLTATGTGTDFTADSRCQGLWLIFTDGTYQSAQVDRCAGTGQGTDDDMVWQGGTWSSTDAPVGSPSTRDAAVLDGSANTYFAITDTGGEADNLEAADFTFMCWGQKDDSVSGYYLWDKNASTGYGYHLNLQTAGSLYGKINDVWEFTGVVFGAGEWGHLALKRSASSDEVEVFRNGVDVCTGGCTGSVGAMPGNTDPLALGSNYAGNNQRLKGKLYECAMFAPSLTTDEIEEVFLCGVDGTADGSWRDGTFSGATCSDINDACCDPN